MEITAYQWVTLALGAAGFIGTWLLGAFKLGRAVAEMQAAIRDEIANERERILAKIDELEQKFEDEQKIQDDRYGEVGHSLRRYIETVEKEMHKIELWGRDNYVQKSEFDKATDSIKADIKALGSEIKIDLRELKAELIDKKN